jgi:hypothetical protein
VRATATAMGAERPMQPPIVDAAVRNLFGAVRLRLGTIESRPTGEAPQHPWWLLSGRAAEDSDVDDLDALVKDWLHIPLFEFGMLDFEEELNRLPLPRWARSMT